jgi:methionine aminopeptidase
MKNAATLARQLLDYITHPSISHAGITTDQLNSLLHYATLHHPTNSAYPSPLNYAGFPKSVCTSVNEVVCHGIPDSRKLQVGDVLSCDVSVFLEGVHGDNCGSVVVGDVEEGILDELEEKIGGVGGEGMSWDWYTDWLSNYAPSTAASVGDSGNNQPMEKDISSSAPPIPIKRDWPTYSLPQKTNFASREEEEHIVSARRLVQAALESRNEGVAACKPGGCLSDVGAAIHAVADAYG